MTARIAPFLVFLGRAEAALSFYARVFGGEVTITRFGDLGLDDTPDAGGVVRGRLDTPDGPVVRAGDVPAGTPYEYGRNVSLVLDGPEDRVRPWFEALAQGGTVTVPLAEPAWGGLFGQVVDRFGIGWVVDLPADRPRATVSGPRGRAT